VFGMSDNVIKLHFDIIPDDFSTAGIASSETKKKLRQLGFNPVVIKKVAISMYEAEINAVIHADGGYADIEITPQTITVAITDKGPGIPDIDQAMQAGWSTATNEIREKGFGAGMGLPNMKRYADDMRIETEVGVGTKITLIININ